MLYYNIVNSSHKINKNYVKILHTIITTIYLKLCFKFILKFLHLWNHLDSITVNIVLEFTYNFLF